MTSSRSATRSRCAARSRRTSSGAATEPGPVVLARRRLGRRAAHGDAAPSPPRPAGRPTMRLIYSVRTAADVIYADELDDDATLTYTREPPAGWAGTAAESTPASSATAAAGAMTAYVCGSNGFVESADTLLRAGRRRAGGDPHRALRPDGLSGVAATAIPIADGVWRVTRGVPAEDQRVPPARGRRRRGLRRGRAGDGRGDPRRRRRARRRDARRPRQRRTPTTAAARPRSAPRSSATPTTAPTPRATAASTTSTTGGCRSSRAR